MNTVRELAKESFSEGLWSEGRPLPRHRAETPLKLAFALLAEGLPKGHVRALALAVRELGEGSTLDADRTLTAAQRDGLAELAAEPKVPEALRALLEEAMPHVKTRVDLYGLYQVLSSIGDRCESAIATARLAATS